jgi:hypothetical protein
MSRFSKKLDIDLKHVHSICKSPTEFVRTVAVSFSAKFGMGGHVAPAVFSLNAVDSLRSKS